MKNLHLLESNKPSRLHLGGSGLVLCDFVFDKSTINGQHIYITSDEEIKEGGWIYYTLALGFCKTTISSKGLEQEGIPAKKIILTTDQDLIKDGVQAIDDEFLEWFVKNPSCESVEVGYGWIRLTETDNEGYWVSIPDKQFEMQQEEPKQETLEEAAERLQKDKYGIFISKDAEVKGQLVIDTARAAFLSGMTESAKWQQQRMYSEEDLKKAIDLARVFSKITENDGYDEFEYTPIEIIQQFKNK